MSKAKEAKDRAIQEMSEFSILLKEALSYVPQPFRGLLTRKFNEAYDAVIGAPPPKEQDKAA